jgi:hypothetical protein
MVQIGDFRQEVHVFAVGAGSVEARADGVGKLIFRR